MTQPVAKLKERAVEYITPTPDNLDQEHIGCDWKSDGVSNRL